VRDKALTEASVYWGKDKAGQEKWMARVRFSDGDEVIEPWLHTSPKDFSYLAEAVSTLAWVYGFCVDPDAVAVESRDGGIGTWKRPTE